jgi:hypothetical protein
MSAGCIRLSTLGGVRPRLSSKQVVEINVPAYVMSVKVIGFCLEEPAEARY